MAILFIAAQEFELKYLAEKLTGLRPLKWPLDYAREGILDGRRIVLAANGAGPKLAAQALEVAIRAITAADLQSSALELVVSVGLCGALNAVLRHSQIVAATTVQAADNGDAFSAIAIESELSYTAGRIVSLDRIVLTSSDKNDLGQRYDALAVEMEAAGVAQRAKRAGLAFGCIKAVSDSADESFRINFNQTRTPDGRLSRVKIVLQALGNPGAVPELFRLRRAADKAARALGDFLVSCRFNLQPTGVVPVDGPIDAV